MCKMSSPRRYAYSLSQFLSFFLCNKQVEEILLEVEQILPPRIKVLLNSTGIEVESYSNETFGTFHD